MNILIVICPCCLSTHTPCTYTFLLFIIRLYSSVLNAIENVGRAKDIVQIPVCWILRDIVFANMH